MVSKDFYPRPPRGGRPTTHGTMPPCGNFYPRPPRGGRPGQWSADRGRHYDFYPRPPRGGRLGDVVSAQHIVDISIHALREEGDMFVKDKVEQKPRISIHALREEGDRERPGRSQRWQDFYPRPPRGGRPCIQAFPPAAHQNFYPRPPRGGRHLSLRDLTVGQQISIHALREEGDSKNRDKISIFL